MEWRPARIVSINDREKIAQEITQLDRRREDLFLKASSRKPPNRSVSARPKPSITVFCPDCCIDVPSKALNVHKESFCSGRVIECPHPGCDYFIRASERKEHERKNCVAMKRRQELLEAHDQRSKEVVCKDCGQQINPNRIKYHLSTQCTERMVPCVLRKFGCTETMRFHELETHLKDNLCSVKRIESRILTTAQNDREEIECDWCGDSLLKKNLVDHQEDLCRMRERECRNAHLGCQEWIPVCEMDDHIHNECIVTLDRNQKADNARAKSAIVSCGECGDMYQLRHHRKHAYERCPSRVVSCRNHIHGCTARYRLRDRSIHEDTSSASTLRPCAKFNGVNTFVQLSRSMTPQINVSRANIPPTPDDANELDPPWTAEFWIRRSSAVDDSCLMAREAMLWSARRVETQVEFELHSKDYDRIKQRMDELRQREADGKSTDEDNTELEECVIAMKSTAMLKVRAQESLSQAVIRIRLCVKASYKAYCELEAASEMDLVHDKLMEITDEIEKEHGLLFSGTEKLVEHWTVPRDIKLYQNLKKWYTAVVKQETEYNNLKKSEEKHKVGRVSKLLHRRNKLQTKLEQVSSKNSKENHRLTRRFTKELLVLDSQIGDSDTSASEGLKGSNGRETLASSKRWAIRTCVGDDDQVGITAVGVNDFVFPYAVPRCQWVHLAFVAELNKVTLYADGQEISSLKAKACLPIHRLGAKFDSFHGHVLEIRYWKTCRSQEELQQMKDKVLRAPTDTLFGYWCFEDGMGEFVEDSALQHSRSLAVCLEWDRFDPRRLGQPPTPSFRERQLCQVAIRRIRLANQAKFRESLAECAQGCGREIPMSKMKWHQERICPHRLVSCNLAGCNKTFKLSKKSVHRKNFCEAYKFRESLVASFLRKEEIVECPLYCGKFFKQRFSKQHMKTECTNRLMLCPNEGCSQTIRYINLAKHNEYECENEELVKTRLLVQRSRQRHENLEYHMADQPVKPFYSQPTASSKQLKSTAESG